MSDRVDRRYVVRDSAYVVRYSGDSFMEAHDIAARHGVAVWEITRYPDGSEEMEVYR